MSNRKVAFSMLLLLLVQVVVPIIPADATSGRTTPDFNVSVMTFSSGGSIDDAGQIKLAPGDHIIVIGVFWFCFVLQLEAAVHPAPESRLEVSTDLVPIRKEC